MKKGGEIMKKYIKPEVNENDVNPKMAATHNVCNVCNNCNAV
jgi:hypothetical protein